MPSTVTSSAAAPVTAEFVRGYASALVKHQFQGEVHAVIVSEGTVYLRGLTLSPGDQKKLIDQLKEIEGVEQIVVASRPASNSKIRISSTAKCSC
jgi:hypothetical protein